MQINLFVTVPLPPTKQFDDLVYEVSLGGSIFNPNGDLGWETFVIDGIKVYSMFDRLQLDSYSRDKIFARLPSWMKDSTKRLTELIIINYVHYAISCDESYKESKNGS